MNVNWQQVCLNLRRYKPLGTVARELSISDDHLRRLARGDVKQPKFNSGLKILDLHLEKLPDLHKPEIICH